MLAQNIGSVSANQLRMTASIEDIYCPVGLARFENKSFHRIHTEIIRQEHCINSGFFLMYDKHAMLVAQQTSKFMLWQTPPKITSCLLEVLCALACPVAE